MARMKGSVCTAFTIFICVLVFMGAPQRAHARVVLSEIMYDLAEGSDSGREWIEIFNEGASVDVTTWKIFEAEVNHRISEFQGAVSLASGAYAIVADNPVKFLEDNPGYSGQLFDSAFSLSNTGETLILRDADLVDRDSVSYTSEWGAAGDGLTLQRTDTGTFEPRSPTLGSGTLATVLADTDNVSLPESSDEGEQVSVVAKNEGSTFPVEPQIFAYGGADRRVLVGADVLFEGKASSKEGELLEGDGIEYHWNFGDGSIGSQQVVSHHFAHPGVYVVVLTVSSGKYSGAHYISVVAEPAALSLRRLPDGAVAITNQSARDIDLSHWHVRVDGSFFTIPANTIIVGKQETVLRADALNLPPGDPVLLYPNGAEALRTGDGALGARVDTSVAVVQGKVASGAPAPQVARVPRTSLVGTPVVPSKEVQRAPMLPETSEEEVSEEPQRTVSSQSASAGVVPLMPEWPWLLGLLGVLGIGGIGVVSALGREPFADGEKQDTSIDVSAWDIIDDGTKVR